MKEKQNCALLKVAENVKNKIKKQQVLFNKKKLHFVANTQTLQWCDKTAQRKHINTFMKYMAALRLQTFLPKKAIRQCHS